MPSKKKKGQKSKNNGKSGAFQKSTAVCGDRGPGPKYLLKPLVGYEDHCASRFRGPAYSIAAKQTGDELGSGPGPKYYAELPRAEGFTFGMANPGGVPQAGPGPYLLPDPPRQPVFTIKWRTELRGGGGGGGLYELPSGLNGPSFTIASRLTGGGCLGGPGPSPPFSIDPVKPKAPAYTLGYRQTGSGICATPGPYNPHEPPRSPAYSFGVKHSPCSPPYITPCDDMC